MVAGCKKEVGVEGDGLVMLGWMRTNWPLITGAVCALVFAAQSLYAYAVLSEQQRANAKMANERIDKIEQEQDEHASRKSHEEGGKTLVRIETQQKAIQKDVTRIQRQIEGVDSKLNHIIRRR